MLIKEKIDVYLREGYNIKNAQNLVAEEIILSALSLSPLKENVTFKGGIVIFNLSNSKRRVTQDLDFDMIHYSIDDESIDSFIASLNSLSEFSIARNGALTQLHQQDYRGIRAIVKISDSSGYELKIKLDIGVQIEMPIKQEKMIFSFSTKQGLLILNANSPEQIVAEKLFSLLKHGVLSTRYKDIYDVYFMIRRCEIDKEEFLKIFEWMLERLKGASNLLEATKLISRILNDKEFAYLASMPANKWIDDDYNHIVEIIINFLKSIQE